MSDKPTMYPYRGYEFGINYRWGDDAGWWYCITSPRLGWVGPFSTHHECTFAARGTIDNNMNAKGTKEDTSDKPTKDEGLAKWPVEDWHPVSRKDVDLLLLEVRDLTASVGELRMGLNALAEKVEKLERDDSTMRRQIGTLARHGLERQNLIHALEYDLDNLKQRPMPRPMTGTIEGLEGVFTVTPPPEWYR